MWECKWWVCVRSKFQGNSDTLDYNTYVQNDFAIDCFMIEKSRERETHTFFSNSKVFLTTKIKGVETG